jgi:tape measure domain-containing protein
LQDATRQVQDFGQKTQQTQQQLSQLPFNAIQNATEQFSRAILNAGNSQDRMRQAITQAQQALAQFNVTVDAGGRMTDRFGQALSGGTADALRQFRTGIREAQAELAQFQRFGIDAGGGGGLAGGGLLARMVGVAGAIGIVTTLAALTTALRDFATESVKVAASMESLHRSFTAIQGSGAAANQTLTALFNTAQRAGISFTDATESFRRLQAGAVGTVLTTQDLQRGFDNIARGATVMGLSTEQVNRTIVALEQTMGKGVIRAEELRQLVNAMPSGLQKMADGLGLSIERFRQMSEAGVLPGTIAFTALNTEMGKLADATGRIEGITASFTRLKNEMTAWMAAIGGWIAEKLVPLVKVITDLSAALRDLFGIPVPGVTTPAPTGTAGAIPLAPSQYTPLIQQEAKRQGIDPGLLSQLVRAESAFNPEATSRAGARGLGQLMLPTAQGLEMGVTAENIAEPERNLRLAAKYLAEMLERFRGLPDQVKLALAAYNAGPGAVDAALKAARMAGTPTTFAGIAPRLPAETQAYVGRVLAPAEGVPGAQPAAAAAATTTALTTNTALAENWRKELEAALKQFEDIKRQVDALATSGMNFNGILSQGVNQQANRLVERLGVISNFFASFPQEAAQMSNELRAQAEAAFRQAAIWKESLLTETQRRDLLRQQVEGMEQVLSRQKATLISQREGQEAAERFNRADTARLQAARIDERTARAGLTLTQQIARDEARLQSLQNESNQLGAELELRRAQAMRPQVESQLQRIESFLGRPEQPQAERAAQAIRDQGKEMQKTLIGLIEELSRHPSLQHLQERAQNALQGFGDAVERQAGIAFEGVDRQMRDTVRGIDDQVSQIGLRIGAAGFTPLAADLAQIERNFAGMTDKLEDFLRQLEKTRLGATTEAQTAIDTSIARVQAVQSQMGGAQAQALLERQERDGKRLIEQAETRLAQMRELPGPQGFPFGAPREVRQLREQAADTDMTDAQRETIRLTEEQMVAQDKLNFAVGVWWDLSQSIGQAWSDSLMGVIDGTISVSQAFENMGKAILKTMADIAAQQATMALFQLGAGILTGALTGALTPTAASGPSSLAPSSTFIGQTLAPQYSFGLQHGGIVREPTRILAGENPAHNPEVILNRQQMQSMFGGNGNGQQSPVSIHNYPSKAAAEQGAAQQRALGSTAIVNAVLDELSTGESSRINRSLRALQG